VEGIRDLRDGAGRLAYTVRGSGPPLVFLPDLFIPVDELDADPPFAQFLDGLASFATVVLLDREGIGFSDPIADWDRPIFDTWADDVARVIRGVVGGRATVLGTGIQSGLTALRVAQTAPEVVERLLLMNVATVAQTSGPSDELLRNIDGESDFDFGSMVAPSRVGDLAYGRWIERAGRRGASPADARRMWEAILTSDVTALEAIAVPTTVLIRPDMTWLDARRGARAIADAIPGAQVIELSGADVYPNCGDVDEVVHAVGEAMGATTVRSAGSSLLTLLFSDIVASTQRTGELGNAFWRGMLDLHDDVVTKVVARHGGTVVKHTGDGALATFALPSRGLRAARALRDELAHSGLEVRMGLHTAEVEQRATDVNGVGVNLAARIMDRAVAGEILVSAAVPLIVAGAEFSFTARGRFALKGVADEQDLFALE
jgi:class 3 adenylate cyclase